MFYLQKESPEPPYSAGLLVLSQEQVISLMIDVRCVPVRCIDLILQQSSRISFLEPPYMIQISGLPWTDR